MAEGWGPRPDWVVVPSEGWAAPRGRTPDGRVLAAPGRRLLGFLVDLAIWIVPQLLVTAGLVVAFVTSFDPAPPDESFSASGSSTGGLSSNGGFSGSGILVVLLLYALLFVLAIVRVAVEAELVARRGQTWGMRALHLRVVDARTGGPLTRGRAWGRAAFSALISGQLLGIGFWWSFFDDRKRTLHDLVCSAVVIDER